jgi:predicted acyl esterase
VFDAAIKCYATARLARLAQWIRIVITSSEYPPKERKMNTCGANDDETSGIVAHNTILHERDHPSRIVFPVME